MTAFVLIRVSIGRVSECLEAVRKIQGVKEAYSVTGIYDIVAKIEVEDVRGIKEVVVDGIHRVAGVESTTTLVAVE